MVASTAFGGGLAVLWGLGGDQFREVDSRHGSCGLCARDGTAGEGCERVADAVSARAFRCFVAAVFFRPGLIVEMMGDERGEE